jgi:hypothetical protein
VSIEQVINIIKNEVCFGWMSSQHEYTMLSASCITHMLVDINRHMTRLNFHVGKNGVWQTCFIFLEQVNAKFSITYGNGI